jgi:hypothetical protein
MNKEKILNDLNDRFASEHPEVLDDDMPDAFDAWLADQDLTEEELLAIE